MLLELRISNFALFDQLQLECVPGFIVFTGETGAGKSLLVDALALLLGGRAIGDQIRTGAEESSLEAIFSVSSIQAVQDWLQDFDLATHDSEELLIRRVLSRSGRNRAYVNGPPPLCINFKSLADCYLIFMDNMISSRCSLRGYSWS